ncbi:MAG TPA: hypothetical protein VNH11_15460 [Pirellulales bacterium]|nr:hypothetical protein [Pirellulales bacterium]
MALAAWKFPGGDGQPLGYRALPPLNIACTGIGPAAGEDEWLKLAEQSGRGMTALSREPILAGLRHLYALFCYPHGLPTPHSDDPTQWFFKGDIATSTEAFQVSVARLLGYRWPEQADTCDAIDALADRDGIVCLSSVRGEPGAAQRLLEVLQAAYGGRWSNALLHDLLAAAEQKAAATLDDWLRNSFFEQHCKLFHQRPFLWHLWDGRKDGFSALVNYHKLDHKALENLTYSYLQDWITAQAGDAKQNKTGADLRLKAAQDLQQKLKLILAGEPPYDIFVRWKALAEQAIGWHPDLNDGVRMNIRPFVAADILRKKPNIKWGKDRGKEPERDRDEYPWFWQDDEPVGDRVNDVHLTNAEKQAARERKSADESRATDETRMEHG